MHGLLTLSLLISCVAAVDVAAAYNNARQAGRRLSPYASSILYASQGEIKRDSGSKGFQAAAVPEEKEQMSHVEMLRFVTAYKTGIEAMVDMTPYTPLLQAAIAGDNLTMYTFIDTWVNNNTEQDILYLNNVTGKCDLHKMSQGNGWSLSASLLFWPRQKYDTADTEDGEHGAGNEVSNTQPRESVTLASGWYGGSYPIGRVNFYAANISENGKALLLDKALDFSTVHVAGVYNLKHDEAPFASLMGFVAQQSEVFTRSGNTRALEEMRTDAFEMLLWSGLAKIDNVTVIDNETQTVQGKYKQGDVVLKAGMPVYFDSSGVFTPHEVDRGLWMNATMPLQPVGEITLAENGNVDIRLKHPCFPGNWSHGLPHLLVPRSPGVVAKVTALVENATEIGIAAASGERVKGENSGAVEPVLLVEAGPFDKSEYPLRERPQLLEPRFSSLSSPTLLGNIDLTTALDGSAAKKMKNRLLLKEPITDIPDGSAVSVLTQERHGQLLHRNFELPHLVDGDRVLFQLAVTGHGWASTAEQCGEYCHAVYRIQLNGRSVANVTQFRDDCKDNPINGSVQFGTWDESRNGWCPGTVVPGMYIDMTDHLQRGSNNMTIDLVVWSNITLAYEPYTDYAGFVFNDVASLSVGITAFVYGEGAVKTIRNQHDAYTAAELAMRQGSSAPERLKPPAFVHDLAGSILLQDGSKAINRLNGLQQPMAAQRSMRSLLQEPSSLLRRGLHHSRIPLDVQSDQVSTRPVQQKVRKRMARAEVQAGGVDIRPHAYLEAQQIPHRHAGVHVEPFQIQGRYNFEQRAPWYLYNETKEGHVEVKRVELFAAKLVQMPNRDVHVHVDKASIPTDWSQVALHFRLHKPEGDLQYDHWDRVGSLGLKL